MASIRRKLLVALLGALAAVGVAAAAATWLAVHREAERLFDYQLEQMALSLRDQTLQGPAALLPQLGYDFIVQVWDPAGSVAYLSDRSVLLPEAGSGFETVAVSGRDWRVFTLVREDKTVQVAAPESLRQDRSAAMALRILVPFLVALPLFAVLIWVLVGRELQPLGAIAADLRRRDPSSLAPLPARLLPAEVAPMVSALNGLLERLRTAIETQKQFTADASHELRTPLAALQLQIELVERARSEEERREALDTLRAGARRATRLAEQLLTLARMEPEAAQAPTAVALERLAAAVGAELEPLAERKRIALRFAGLDPATVRGSEAALQTLARNLVDNAIRYTPPGGEVTLRTGTREGTPFLEVQDSGPGIPPAERERVFDRFYRLAGAGVEGSGLGLAIAKCIADAHRASIVLDEGANGTGLRVVVKFMAGGEPPSPGSSGGATEIH
ncbi:MAG TPA: ATP-binding protein [Burkholderiales bacterium]|nr:ATP-binding protein [Burkholderiales bacterium]